MVAVEIPREVIHATRMIPKELNVNWPYKSFVQKVRESGG